MVISIYYRDMNRRRGRSADNLLPAVPDSDTIPSMPGPSGTTGKRAKADQSEQSKRKKDDTSFVETARPGLRPKGAKKSSKRPDSAKSRKSVTEEDLEMMVNEVDTTSSSGSEESDTM